MGCEVGFLLFLLCFLSPDILSFTNNLADEIQGAYHTAFPIASV
jgi:hypothetical protein